MCRWQLFFIFDFDELVHRQFGTWSMGLVTAVADNQALFLKYATGPEFNPYQMRPAAIRAFFEGADGEHALDWVVESAAITPHV